MDHELLLANIDGRLPIEYRQSSAKGATTTASPPPDLGTSSDRDPPKTCYDLVASSSELQVSAFWHVEMNTVIIELCLMDTHHTSDTTVPTILPFTLVHLYRDSSLHHITDTCIPHQDCPN